MKNGINHIDQGSSDKEIIQIFASFLRATLRFLRFPRRPLRETLFLILIMTGTLHGQEVKNLRVSQVVNRVNIVYDLEGQVRYYKVALFYTTDDGKTWWGPLKNVNGDIGEKQTPGVNKTIVWDALAEKGPIEGMLQFKVVADLNQEAGKAEAVKKIRVGQKKSEAKPWLDDEKFNRAKSSKTTWLISALVTAGIGTFSYLQADKLYDQYQAAESDAEALHNKIAMYDKITPIAFGIAGGCTVGFIIGAARQGKIKKQLSVQPVSLVDGGGIKLALTF